MQRIINDPNLVVEEMLRGFVKSRPDLVSAVPENPRVLKYVRAPIKGKVGVVTGGGSGHKPAFIALRLLKHFLTHSKQRMAEPESLAYMGITPATI